MLDVTLGRPQASTKPGQSRPPCPPPGGRFSAPHEAHTAPLTVPAFHVLSHESAGVGLLFTSSCWRRGEHLTAVAPQAPHQHWWVRSTSVSESGRPSGPPRHPALAGRSQPTEGGPPCPPEKPPAARQVPTRAVTVAVAVAVVIYRAHTQGDQRTTDMPPLPPLDDVCPGGGSGSLTRVPTR